MQKKQSKPHSRKNQQKKPASLPKELAARQAAFRCLMDVMKKQQPLDQAMAVIRQATALSSEDRGFAEHLVKLVLKRQLVLPDYIEQFLIKPIAQLPIQAQIILYMGAAQLHYMNVPNYAAVNTMVELAKHCHLHRLTGMMNVVLKKISQNKPDVSADALLEAAPHWMRKRLCNDYGKQAATILEHSLHDIDYVDLTLKASLDKADYASRLGAEMLEGYSLRLAFPNPISTLPGYKQGDWWVQDHAAALPIHGIKKHVQGKRVLDACAAPGGKTMQLVSYGADVTALDRSKRRLERMSENMQRTDINVDVICADLLEYSPEQPFDVVVLDAPCSATGTLRRNPDILYHRSDEDIDKVVALQQELLQRASEWVNEGGYMLYCSCSLFACEGEAQIAEFLKENHGFERADFTDMPDYVLNARGEYRSLPHYQAQRGGMDGFFAGFLRKVVSS